MSSILSRQTVDEVFPSEVLAWVDQPISEAQAGRVKALGTSWPARLAAAGTGCELLPGQRVRAIGRQGITLLVVPLEL